MTEQAPHNNNFEQAGNGLYLPTGLEDVVNPAESALNGAMHIGMEEKGLGSVRYPSEADQEAKDIINDKAYGEILDPRNVIELKQSIDNVASRKNDEERHLTNVKDGSRAEREARNSIEARSSLIDEYLQIGSETNDREIPELVRSDLENMLDKSYEELEELGAKREAKSSPSNAEELDNSNTVDAESEVNDVNSIDTADKPKGKDAAQSSEPKNEVIDTPKQAEEAKRLRESAEKGDIVRFRNKDGKLEEWEVRHIGNADKHGDKGVLLRKTDGSGDEQVRTYDYMLDDLEEGPVEARNNKKSNKNVEMELYQTTDPDEARKYWEENQEKLGSSLEAYMAHGHEGSWLVERPVEKKTPVEPIPTKPTIPAKPVVPTKPTLPTKEPKLPKPVVPTIPTQEPITERTPVVPEKGPRRPGRVRKFGRACLALLALAPIGYAVGRLHENYIVKSHDVPELDANNKFADHVRDEPVEVQTNIANNWGTAQEFFGENGIASEQGAENFQNMEEAIEAKVEALKGAEEYRGVSEEKLRELAEFEIRAGFAAAERDAARAEVSGAK